MRQEDIDRINTLYHKMKAVGLSEEEKLEQAKLRRMYLESTRANMRGTLDNTYIKNPDGSETSLKEVYEKNHAKKNKH